jgi:hypothetical protein
VPQAAGAVASGGIAGAVFWSVMLPVDGAKTRIQAAVPGGVDDVGVWAHLRRVRAWMMPFCVEA